MRAKFQTPSICTRTRHLRATAGVRAVTALRARFLFSSIRTASLWIALICIAAFCSFPFCVAAELESEQRSPERIVEAASDDAGPPAAVPSVAPDHAAAIDRLLSKMEPATDSAVSAVPVLLSALENSDVDPLLRERSAKMLARIGKPAQAAVPVLIRLLSQSDASAAVERHSETFQKPSNVRYWSMKSLGVFGSLAAEAIPVVAGILTDNSSPDDLKILAADTLGQIGSPAAAGILTTELMKPRTDDTNGSLVLRQTIIDSLALTGPLAVGAIPALARATEDSHEVIRRQACAALGSLGPRAEGGLSTLLERLVLDTEPAVKDAAADALAQLGAVSVPSLINLLERGEPGLQWRAARALGQIGGAARSSVPQLKHSFTSSSGQTRIEAIDSVWKITRNASLVEAPLLIELTSEDRQIRRRAAQMLIELESLSNEVSRTLIRMSQSDDDKEAQAAAYVIRERTRRNDQ